MRQRDRARFRLPSVQEVVAHHRLTREQYIKLLDAQGTRCGICGRHAFLRLDCDEITGEVRGLLCAACCDGLRYLDADLGRLFSVYFYRAFPPRQFGSKRVRASARYVAYLRRWLDDQVTAVAS